MVETDKVIAGKMARRVRLKWSWVLAAALLVSVAVNLYFANRVLYFGANHPFHPICLAEADENTRAAVNAELQAALAPHAEPQGVRMASSAWIVTAKRG